jgi:hypothetical protein
MKYTYLLFALLIFACSSPESTSKKVSLKESAPTNDLTETDKQLNITVLLDLSDRVVREASPSQDKKDLEIINTLVSAFKENNKKRGAFLAKGKFKILFSPAPSNPDINTLASNLSVDFSKMDNMQKKNSFDNMESSFSTSLAEIYNQTITSQDWSGSDIWRFFKYDAKDFSIDQSTDYRNILFIVTDGYIYHDNSKEKEGNRSSYITGPLLQSAGLRTNNWKSKFDSGDYGLIPHKVDYSDLEIVVLEINPNPTNMNDEDIIRAYLGKWFSEMNVSKSLIYNTDLPENTKMRIENYFRN